MRCHICNAVLTRVEIVRDERERGGYKPCRDCIFLSTGRTSINDLIDKLADPDYLPTLMEDSSEI